MLVSSNLKLNLFDLDLVVVDSVCWYCEKAKSELKRSAVADNLSGQSKLSEVRTSSGMFIPKGKVTS